MAAVFGEQKVAILRVEIVANRITHTKGHSFGGRSVKVHPIDLCVLAKVADVARRADGVVKIVVMHAQKFSAVVAFAWQFFVQHCRFA